MRAKDWHSLPVPPVVGMAINGSMGLRGLADTPVILHLAAVGENEVAALGGVHAAAAAQADDEIDVVFVGELATQSATSWVVVYIPMSIPPLSHLPDHRYLFLQPPCNC